MILVTGGTGTIGGEVVRLLRERGEPFTVMVRTVAKAKVLQADGVETVVGDLADPASLVPALKGAASLFLLSPSVANQGELQLNAIEAARTAGVGFVLKVSALGADPESPLTIGRAHAAAEAGLVASGIPHTILRPGSFMQNFLASADSIRSQDQFVGSAGEGRTALVDARDIALVAAAILTGQGHAGRVYTLTGPEALSNAEAAAVLSDVTGRPIRYVDLPADAYRAGLIEAGLEAWLADDLVTIDAAVARGHGGEVTDDVERVSGESPPHVRPVRGGLCRGLFEVACARGDRGPVRALPETAPSRPRTATTYWDPPRRCGPGRAG